MRKNLLVAAVGAFLGALLTYFVKDDQIIKLKSQHAVALKNERSHSYNAGWDARAGLDQHPHFACTTCNPTN